MQDLGFEEVLEHERNFLIKAKLYFLGKDLLVVISGPGEHIGSMTLAQPYIAPINPNIKPEHTIKNSSERISSSINTLTQYKHRDDQILSEFARSLSKDLNLVVAVVGGLHLDNITKSDIEIISKMTVELKERIKVKVIKEAKNI